MSKRRFPAILILMIALIVSVAAMGQADAQYPKVFFDARGGTFPNGTEKFVLSIQKGEKIVFPSEPKKEGFVFCGWYTKAGGGGERIQPSAVSEDDLNCFAWWAPIEQTEVYTVSVVWVDSAADGAEYEYRYHFVESGTGAQYSLTLDETDIWKKSAKMTEMRAQIRLPKRTPSGKTASYGAGSQDSPFLVRGAAVYAISYQETGERGDAADQSTYFRRVRLCRRMIAPNVRVGFVNAPAQEFVLTLRYKPIAKGQNTAEATASCLPGDAQTSVSLLKLFGSKLPELGYLALDEVDFQLNYLGRNEYVLEAKPIEGFTLELEGNASDGWAVTYTKNNSEE